MCVNTLILLVRNQDVSLSYWLIEEETETEAEEEGETDWWFWIWCPEGEEADGMASPAVIDAAEGMEMIGAEVEDVTMDESDLDRMMGGLDM